MKKLLAILLLNFAAAAGAATLQEYEALESAAKAGDYQAQRNVAY